MSRKIDPRISRTKELFENALLDLMEKKEFNKITVQQIAEQSTLNRATFYLHYYDKYDLLEQLLESALIDLRKSVAIFESEFTYASNYAHPTLKRLFEKVMENDKFYKIMLVDEKFPNFIESINGVIEELVRQGTDYMLEDGIEFNVPVEISVSYYAAAYLGVLIWWLKQDMPYTPKYMATQLTSMSTTGQYITNPYIGQE